MSMVLAPLNNQVVFKKLFRDPEILQAFLYDLIGIRLNLRSEDIELEKKFHPVVGNVDIAIDIFVDDPVNRLIIELQREFYDYHYDRFLSYHQAATMELVKSYHDYRLHRTVHTIVWLTQKIPDPTYQHSLITTSLCSEAEDGQRINIYPHRLYFLNPFYITNQTPAGVADWMNLVVESILHPGRPRQVNYGRSEIVRAMDLIKDDGLTPQERAAMLDDIELRRTLTRNRRDGWEEGKQEGFQEGEQKGKQEGKQEQAKETAKKLLERGFAVSEVSDLTGLSGEEMTNL